MTTPHNTAPDVIDLVSPDRPRPRRSDDHNDLRGDSNDEDSDDDESDAQTNTKLMQTLANVMRKVRSLGNDKNKKKCTNQSNCLLLQLKKAVKTPRIQHILGYNQPSSRFIIFVLTSIEVKFGNNSMELKQSDLKDTWGLPPLDTLSNSFYVLRVFAAA